MKPAICLFAALLGLLGVTAQCIPPPNLVHGDRPTAEATITRVVAASVDPPIPTYSPSPGPSQPITVSLAVSLPLVVGERVPVTVTLHAYQAQQDVRVGLILLQGQMPSRQDWRPWRLPEMDAGQTIQLTTTAVFPAYNHYHLRTEIHTGSIPLPIAAMDTLLIEIPQAGEPVIVTASPYPTSTGQPYLSTPIPAPASPAGTWMPPQPTNTPSAARPTPQAREGSKSRKECGSHDQTLS